MSKIGGYHLFAIILLSTGLMNHVIIVPLLLVRSGRDSWMVILLIGTLFLLLSLPLHYIHKKSNSEPIFSWVESRLGNKMSVFLSYVSVFVLLLLSMVTLKDTVTWVKYSYLPDTPVVVSTILLLLLCCISAYYGLGTIAISAGFIFPSIIILGHFVMAANLPKKDYSLLFPLFENGYGTIVQGAFVVAGGLSELIIILFLQHHLKSRLKLWVLFLLAFMLMGLIIGPVTGIISTFGPYEASELRYPAYTLWRLLQIGKYITNVDFLALYQWSSGSFIRLSLTFLLVIELIGIKQIRAKLVMLSALFVLMLVTVLLPISDNQLLYLIHTYYFPIVVGWFFLLLTVFGIVSFLSKEVIQHDESKQ
ncbi:endospore germination permease [Bacillus luteolus]|uniref:Endospore germination permease n=1 Tax=Litchfieldia luteola TaxID=682179 RepID=A0ABR9QGE5_9BACI|nr:endospore germination permease [Cytobacillus luteolus]MBE4907569.1 endospore germination permease [Cytobacillus luteolus]MBP1944342.1 spore germination protein (amino acid permease) [Cytobacillus luteolus]